MEDVTSVDNRNHRHNRNSTPRTHAKATDTLWPLTIRNWPPVGDSDNVIICRRPLTTDHEFFSIRSAAFIAFCPRSPCPSSSFSRFESTMLLFLFSICSGSSNEVKRYSDLLTHRPLAVLILTDRTLSLLFTFNSTTATKFHIPSGPPSSIPKTICTGHEILWFVSRRSLRWRWALSCTLSRCCIIHISLNPFSIFCHNFTRLCCVKLDSLQFSSAWLLLPTWGPTVPSAWNNQKDASFLDYLHRRGELIIFGLDEHRLPSRPASKYLKLNWGSPVLFNLSSTVVYWLHWSFRCSPPQVALDLVLDFVSGSYLRLWSKSSVMRVAFDSNRLVSSSVQNGCHKLEHFFVLFSAISEPSQRRLTSSRRFIILSSWLF